MKIGAIMPKNQASKGAAIGIAVYLLLAITKINGGILLNSASVYADGLNNLSDIIASTAVYIGLFISNRPNDDDHHFDHNKYETLASFIVSILMFNIGLNIIGSGIDRIKKGDFPVPDPKVFWITIISSLLLFITQRYIQQLARKTHSLGLRATSKDMFSDFLITISTLIGTFFATLGFPILDTLLSIAVGGLTILSAYDIIKESTYVLSDGFDNKELEKYRNGILRHPKVFKVPKIRARLSGSKVYVDVIIEIDGNLSVTESHIITEEVERILRYNYGVNDIDVHVEPYIPS